MRGPRARGVQSAKATDWLIDPTVSGSHETKLTDTVRLCIHGPAGLDFAGARPTREGGAAARVTLSVRTKPPLPRNCGGGRNRHGPLSGWARGVRTCGWEGAGNRTIPKPGDLRTG